jgi:hypothetical protein
MDEVDIVKRLGELEERLPNSLFVKRGDLARLGFSRRELERMIPFVFVPVGVPAKKGHRLGRARFMRSQVVAALEVILQGRDGIQK